MARTAGISGTAVGMATAGGVLLYAGISGAGIRETLQEIARGRLPEMKEPTGDAISRAEKEYEAGKAGAAATAGSGDDIASADKLVSAALKYKGVPYKWGGTSPTGLDCSGLVVRAFRDAYGVIAPRTTYTQILWSKLKKVSSIKPGDLLFWPRTGNPSHVGIAVDSSTVIHAPRPGKVVEVVPISRAFKGGMKPSVYRYTG